MFRSGLTGLLARRPWRDPRAILRDRSFSLPLPILLGAFWLACSTFISSASTASRTDTSKVDFNREVRPILSENCYKCHGPDDAARKAKLRFDLRADALKPAKSGAIAIVPNAPDKSALIERITASDPDDRMPPASTGKKLSPAQIDTLRRWITQGAPYATHWAYVKPVRPPLPEVKNQKWTRNPLDNFILARLERGHLKPSPEADRYTLIRRVSLDLTGIPPTLDEVDQFVKDRDPHAYEHLVDRILSKPSFGEHWARLWLDLARYADSAGYADDPPRTIWAYRDYVIKSFNANKPFDRFTLEQIAGDLLGETDEDDEVATAFHRNTMTNNEGGTSDEEFRNAAVVDRVNTTMAVWMATSMGCAQCHNHKYDPITQREYFSFFAFFNNSADADRKDEAPVLELFTPEEKQRRAKWQDEITQIEKSFKATTPESLRNQAAWERDYPSQDKWTLLDPVRPKRRSADEEAPPSDHAVTISPQTNSHSDFLEFPLDLARLAAIRVEALPSATNTPDAAYAITHIGATLIVPATNRPAARYVRLELPGKDRILSIAEVQVIHGGKNIARDGVATQSSTAFNAPASRAIDGKTSGDFDAGSTTHTETSENPWWEVDLKEAQTVDRITVWNRTDHNLQDRMKDLHITLLDENRKPVWERIVEEAPSPKVAFSLLAPDPIKFTVAFSDSGSTNSAPAEVIADQVKGDKKGWLIEPGKRTNSLTLLPPRALEVPRGSRLQLTVEHTTHHPHCPPARLQASASADERFPKYASSPAPILEALSQTSGSRSKSQLAEISEYYRSNIDPSLATQRTRLAELKKDMAALQPNTVPVMRELPADKQRVTHIQFRGNYQSLGDEVTMATPAVFQPLPKAKSPNRLALAQWLVDNDNPLTARVLANRLWEQIFGLGIVRTSDDFGSQGDLPTNPELLDWLACQLRDGGTDTCAARPWDIKEFLKLLVTSATYRQTSRVTPELRERDPDNILLARGPRFRASAEVVRDQALAVSGLLSHKMYGPPVRPPSPALGLSAAFGGSLDWKTSEGEDRYRRAVYVEWRRTSPYPSMVSFDAPNRETCALRRPRSNTPLQALVVLNDPVYVEAAQALGRRIASAPGSNTDKITYGFRLCLVRPPHPTELRRLLQFYDQARSEYASKPDQAKQMVSTDMKPASNAESTTDLAAWTAVGNVLLNLDETLMKP